MKIFVKWIIGLLIAGLALTLFFGVLKEPKTEDTIIEEIKTENIGQISQIEQVQFNWSENPQLEEKDKRDHSTKVFKHPTDPSKRIAIISGGLFHAYTDKGFEDISTELPDYNFPVGKAITKKEAKSYIMDMPSWGDAKVEKNGQEVAVYDKKGVSVFRYKNPLVVKAGDNPYKVVKKDDNSLVRETKNEHEEIQIDEKILKTDKAVDTNFSVENGKMYFIIPEMPSYPLEAYDDTDVSSTNNKDTQLVKGAPTTNYGGDTTFVINWLDSSNINRAIISFTTPDIVGTITDCKLYLYQVAHTGTVLSVDIHELSANTDWVENQATWNIAKTSVNWGTAGGDFSATVIDTFAGTSTDNAFYNLVIMGAGATNPVTILANTAYHFLIKPTVESGVGQRYSIINSKEHATTNTRPYLEITYEPSATRRRLHIINP